MSHVRPDPDWKVAIDPATFPQLLDRKVDAFWQVLGGLAAKPECYAVGIPREGLACIERPRPQHIIRRFRGLDPGFDLAGLQAVGAPLR